MHGDLGVGAIGPAPRGSAVPDRDAAALERAAAGAHEEAGRIGGRPRDDVDDAVDGVGAPDRAARTADHFDAIDVLEHQVFGVPEHAAEERVVDRPAVDQHEQLGRREAVEPADRDRPFVGVDLGHLDTRHQPQQVGHRRHARSPDVVVGDDVDGGRHVLGALVLARGRGDLDVHEIFERREIGGPGLCVNPRRAQQPDEEQNGRAGQLSFQYRHASCTRALRGTSVASRWRRRRRIPRDRIEQVLTAEGAEKCRASGTSRRTSARCRPRCRASAAPEWKSIASTCTPRGNENADRACHCAGARPSAAAAGVALAGDRWASGETSNSCRRAATSRPASGAPQISTPEVVACSRLPNCDRDEEVRRRRRQLDARRQRLAGLQVVVASVERRDVDARHRSDFQRDTRPRCRPPSSDWKAGFPSAPMTTGSPPGPMNDAKL